MSFVEDKNRAFWMGMFIVVSIFIGILFSFLIQEEKQTEVIESPQKHLIVGDVVSTTEEFWMWKGDTTSFTAYVINVSNNGIVYLKIKDGSWKGDGNNYSLNEYWIEKVGHVNESEYKGWHWP